MDDRWWILDHSRRLMAAALMLAIIAGLAISGVVILRNTLRPPLAPAMADSGDDVEAPGNPTVELQPS
jgi:hypothetical protein